MLSRLDTSAAAIDAAILETLHASRELTARDLVAAISARYDLEIRRDLADEIVDRVRRLARLELVAHRPDGSASGAIFGFLAREFVPVLRFNDATGESVRLDVPTDGSTLSFEFGCLTEEGFKHVTRTYRFDDGAVYADFVRVRVHRCRFRFDRAENGRFEQFCEFVWNGATFATTKPSRRDHSAEALNY